MKKHVLAILIYVLALIGVSNAGLSFIQIINGQLGILSNDNRPYTCYVAWSPFFHPYYYGLTALGTQNLSSITNLGSFSGNEINLPGGTYQVQEILVCSTSPLQPGLHYTIDFGFIGFLPHSGEPGVYLLDENLNIIDSFGVPEPCTLLLLGVGWMMVRKR